jgi:glycosyltransferase involved in cell wall biosynthesis
VSSAPTLSVVIPYYEEPVWLPVILGDLERAIARSPLDTTEIIVVDDGSPTPAERVVAAAPVTPPLRTIRQPNAGRFAARHTGIQAATGELVLLLDSRVSLREGALAFVATQLAQGRSPVWNAHVHVDVSGNPLARFWNVLTDASYAHYFDDPQTACFGLEDFDLYPKGTTCFLGPRTSLLAAFAAFTTRYDDLSLANDDTPIIRYLAERHGVCISPGFSCDYRSRDALRPFLRHAFHRGTVFVDGHAVANGRFLPIIVAFYPTTVIALAVALRWPRLAVASAAAVPGAAAAFAIGRRRPPADIGAVAALSLPWLGVFGAGMWRGLWITVRTRAARSRRPAASRR